MKRVAARAACALVTASPAVVLAVMGYGRRWVTEDAFIDFRVVQQILAGRGPVFNAGERVEAYTSPLWVALLAAWGALGGPLEKGSVALGLVFSVLGVLLAQWGAWRLATAVPAASGAETAPVPLPLGAAVFAVIPVAWDFTTSGLESGLVIGWLGAAFWLLARPRPISVGALSAAALVIGCGPLVRPDLFLFSAAFAAVLAVLAARGSARRLALRHWVGLLLCLGLLPVSYQIFRMGYFAALVPNTAFAKEASLPYWSQGWRYTQDFVLTYWLWLPLPAAAAWAAGLLARARRARDPIAASLVAAPMLAAIVHAIYVMRVGGDFMHGRVLLPTLFAFLLPVATVAVPARAPRARSAVRAAVLAGVLVWAIACGTWMRVPYEGQGAPGRWGIADERGYYQFHINARNPMTIDTYAHHPALVRFTRGLPAFDGAVAINHHEGLIRLSSLKRSAPPSTRMVLGLANIGVLGYLAGLDTHVVDQLGLADPIAGRIALAERGRPGHEKWLTEPWIAGRFGDPGAAPPLPPPALDAARAMECGALARLLRAVDDPLTVSRFLHNVRAAWSLSKLRIPADPTAARAQFCAAPAAKS